VYIYIMSILQAQNAE